MSEAGVVDKPARGLASRSGAHGARICVNDTKVADALAASRT
jgi:hypothetical protein